MFHDYEVYNPGTEVDRPLHELPRSVAQAAHARLMASRETRINELRKLLSEVALRLSTRDEDLLRVNEWFVENVDRDPAVSDRLRPEWYSVVNDLALYLGEELITKYPHIHWELSTRRKSDVSYHRSVLVGFPVANRAYSVDFDLLLGMYGHRVIAGDEDDNEYLLKMFHAACETAVE